MGKMIDVELLYFLTVVVNKNLIIVVFWKRRFYKPLIKKEKSAACYC